MNKNKLEKNETWAETRRNNYMVRRVYSKKEINIEEGETKTDSERQTGDKANIEID